MSKKIGVVVQARMSSSRLPGKSLKKIGPHPLIWYVVKRLEHLHLPIVVATSQDTSDDVLVDYLQEQNILYFRGSLDNVLQRYIKTAETFQFEQIVRVTGDNPFVDVDYLARSLPMFEHYNYIDGIYEGGLLKGTGFEMVTLSELKSIPSENKDHLEHVTLWLRENMAASSKKLKLAPNVLNKYREDIYLTCDYAEDFVLIAEILKYFNYQENLPLEKVIQFTEHNPHLKRFNSSRHLKN